MRAPMLAVFAVLALFPAAAQAASVTITPSADPLEDRPVTFTSTAVTDGQPYEVFAKVRPDSAVPCAPKYSAETGTDVFFSDPAGTAEVETFKDPGAYRVCGYLQEFSSDSPAAVTGLVVTVRANAARLAVSVPPAAITDVKIPVVFSGGSELGRELYAKTKPAGSGPCGPSREADPSTDSFVFGQAATGPFAYPVLAGPFPDPGVYTICAWLQESSSDAVAEATATATVTVRPPVPRVTDLDIRPVSFPSLSSGRSITGSFRGAGVSYALNGDAATVHFTVERKRSGRRVGKACRTLTRGNRRRKPCVLYKRVRGSFSAAGTSGSNRFNFSGRIGGRRLGLGRYRLAAQARNAGGTGKTLHRSFRIIRTPR